MAAAFRSIRAACDLEERDKSGEESGKDGNGCVLGGKGIDCTLNID
jgi:hypothetical protein